MMATDQAPESAPSTSARFEVSRLSADQRKLIRRAAADADQTVGAWARDVLVRVAREQLGPRADEP